MKINEVTKKIEPSKPRNFVAKNATTSGAGQHKDKAKTIPRKEKHKGKQYDLAEARSVVNFDGEDLRMLNHIDDLDVLKDAAFKLISNKEGKHPMKPEKVEWFRHHLAEKTNKNAIIKMMYDLLLAGSGMSVVGSKNSMASNSYRSRFSEDGEPMKIKAVAGNDVTIDQGGQEIKTTADALAPGQTPGSFTMKPADPNAMKPGATVTQDAAVAEEGEEELMPVAPDDNGIHTEKDVDLMGSGHNHSIGGDATDRFISQVTDKGFERAQRKGREGIVGRAKLGENDELTKMLTIAGLK